MAYCNASTNNRSIYKEIGAGERISLAKLAVEHLEKTGQRFRLAIDVSIWQFQIQSGQGGRNPALRTLYYRLLKLLALSIRPLFVFDGPNKPKFKRNFKIAPNAACLDNLLTKQLLKRFSFPYHDAPGEAEAECALLQKEGIVDAVLSEDVDTMMFGCTRSLRTWTAESTRGNKTPTHVNMYTAETTEKIAGLDSQGMMFVALMSGGDYNTEGLPKCGPKTACEAARAGFGRELCQLAKDDGPGWEEWRERLQRELATNESKFFGRKHGTIKIPENFPDQVVLGYYKHPAVSSSEKVVELRQSLKWDTEVDVPELRSFVAEAFNWPFLMGAKHFIKTLAPCLLAHKLIEARRSRLQYVDDLEAQASAEEKFVKNISGRRAHWNTDGSQELRIAFIPADIVGLDLSLEEDIDRRDDDSEEVVEVDDQGSDGEGRVHPVRPTKRCGPATYDPTQPEKIWMLETFVKLGVPLLVETWEEDMRNPKRIASRKPREKGTLAKKATKGGAMDSFVKITKPGLRSGYASGPKPGEDAAIVTPPVFLAPAIATAANYVAEKALEENRRTVGKSPKKKAALPDKKISASTKAVPEGGVILPTSPSTQKANPWILSKRPPDTYDFRSPTRYSALGIYAPEDPESQESRPRRPASPGEQSFASNGLDSPPASHVPAPGKKHSRLASTLSAQSDQDSGAALPLENITHRTPRRRDAAEPSPRKNRNPSEMADDLFIAGQLKKPASMRKDREIVYLNLSDTQETPVRELLTARKTNRRLDFFNNNRSPPGGEPPVSDHSSLPSPSALFSPNPKEMSWTGQPATAEFLKHSKASKNTKDERIRKLIALRESLEGAWKPVEQWEASAAKDVFSSVEVLDLTGS